MILAMPQTMKAHFLISIRFYIFTRAFMAQQSRANPNLSHFYLKDAEHIFKSVITLRIFRRIVVHVKTIPQIFYLVCA